MKRKKSTRGLALLGALFVTSACGPPIQEGTIVVLPGATERLMVAMQMGYRGVGEAKPPASVRQATSKEELATGTGAQGKIGDYVLENGSVVGVVAALDGTDRGGTLIDVAREPRRNDEIDSFVTKVLGKKVRYDALKTGTDTATGAAFVEVSGSAGSVPVSTRYDLAPELDAIVVHTSFTRPATSSGDADEQPFDVCDEVALAWPNATHFTRGELKGALAAYGKREGYAIVPLGDPNPHVATHADGGALASIGLERGGAPEGLFVYSRMVVPLERADSLATSSALALSRGEDLGEVEVSVFPPKGTKGMLVPPGKLVFQGAADTAPVEMAVTSALHLGDAVNAKVPAGAWDVSFVSDAFRSPSPVHVTVRARQLSTVEVGAQPSDAPPPVTTASASPP